MLQAPYCSACQRARERGENLGENLFILVNDDDIKSMSMQKLSMTSMTMMMNMMMKMMMMMMLP